MGLFGKNDELFELMSKNRQPAKDLTTSTHSERRTSTTRSWRGARKKIGPDVYELDGDPLIVVEDGWLEGFDTEELPSGGFLAVRTDTMVVGGFLVAGLLLGAFLLGRTTEEELQPPTIAIVQPVSAEAEAAPASPVGLSGMLPPLSAEQPAPAQQTTTPAQALTASFRGNSASTITSEAGASPHEATTVGASAPARDSDAATVDPKLGKFVLVVCTTRPQNAVALAKWLNEDAVSPIFGRGDLEAYSTRRGVVRISGFGKRERDVLARVRATCDPLGGSGTFHSAYFRSP